MTYTMEQMWAAANAAGNHSDEEATVGDMLAECLNRIDATQEYATLFYGQQEYFGTTSWDQMEHVMYLLDGEPDGADD